MNNYTAITKKAKQLGLQWYLNQWVMAKNHKDAFQATKIEPIKTQVMNARDDYSYEKESIHDPLVSTKKEQHRHRMKAQRDYKRYNIYRGIIQKYPHAYVFTKYAHTDIRKIPTAKDFVHYIKGYRSQQLKTVREIKASLMKSFQRLVSALKKNCHRSDKFLGKFIRIIIVKLFDYETDYEDPYLRADLVIKDKVQPVNVAREYLTPPSDNVSPSEKIFYSHKARFLKDRCDDNDWVECMNGIRLLRPQTTYKLLYRAIILTDHRLRMLEKELD